MTGPNNCLRSKALRSDLNPDNVRCSYCGSLYVRPRKRPPGFFACNTCDNVFHRDDETFYQKPRRSPQKAGSGVIAGPAYATGYRWSLSLKTILRG